MARSESEASIVGSKVRDQARLRPQEPVRDLDEFLEFLARLEVLFGPIAQKRPLARGSRFLL